MKKIFLIFSVLSAPFFLSQKKADPKMEMQKRMGIESTKAGLQLSKHEIELYNGVFLKFITALKMSDRKGMEALLSEKARKMVTEVVYQKLSKDIKSDKAFEIITTGYKPLIDGSSYPMIRYRYADDKAAEPKDVITAVFEKDGKILGIKPFRITK